MASSLRSFSREDVPAVLDLSRRAFGRPEEQVGNPLWASLDELESELSDWDEPPETTLLVDVEDGQVVGFGGVEVAKAFPHADLFGPLIAPGYRGQKLGSEILDASIAIALEHGRTTVIASVGPRNVSGRILLEHTGFHPRGPAKAVFRLAPEEHKAVVEGPEDIEVRRGEVVDLELALRLYHETFPEGVFPDDAWRDGLARGSVYLAERGGTPLAFLNLDPSDRWAYQIGRGRPGAVAGDRPPPALARPGGVLEGASRRGRGHVGRSRQHARPPPPAPPGLRALARAPVVRALALGGFGETTAVPPGRAARPDLNERRSVKPS